MSKNPKKEKKFSSKYDDFTDCIVCITGAARGIGAEIASEFAATGASLFLVDKERELLEKTGERLRETGVFCITSYVDVTDRNTITSAIETCVKQFGRIDILVNNAGTIHPADFFSMSEADWDFLQAVDLKGVVFCTQAVAVYMKEQQYGRIINISSMAARGVYMPGFSSYSAAKAAVNDFTKVSARELGSYGVTVNAVAPGEIMTELTYQDQSEEEVAVKLERSREMSMVKRIGKPEDVASLVRFLASDDASFITGEIIGVDGGRIDRM